MEEALQSWKFGRAFRVGSGSFGPGSAKRWSRRFGPISGLHTIFFRNDGHVCPQWQSKQSC